MSPVILGFVAGAFTTSSSLPQIYYVLKTRSMKDVSLVTLGMFAFGVSLWLGYGIIIHALPVILWNSLSLSLYLTQLGLKLWLSRANASSIPASRARRAQAALTA